MATNVAISAALAAAQSLAVSPSQMMSLLDVAIASAMVDAANGGSSGPYSVTIGSDGTSISFATLDSMTAAREYYRRQNLISLGGLTSLAPEFGNDGQRGPSWGANN